MSRGFMVSRDAFVFGLIFFLSVFISVLTIPAPYLEDIASKLALSAQLGLSVAVVSFVAMWRSGKYSQNPVQNTSKKTWWTWWTLEDK